MTDDEFDSCIGTIYKCLSGIFPSDFLKINFRNNQSIEIEAKKLLDKYPDYISREDKKIFSEQIFCGNGDYSAKNAMALHQRLNYGLSYLSGEQQNGGMGSEYSEKEANESRTSIDGVIEDIIVALGAKDRFKKVI